MFSIFEQQRIDNLKREIIENYNRTQIVDKIVNKSSIETDGDFMQVYIRYILERIWFRDESHYPAFGAIGGSIARSELNYLISKIGESAETEAIEYQRITPSLFLRIFDELNIQSSQISILASVEKMYLNFLQNRNWSYTYDYQNNANQIKVGNIRFNLWPYHGAEFGSDIIIIPKSACVLNYKKYEDPIVGLTPLKFQVNPKDEEKLDLLIHSTVKIGYLNSEKVKIYQVEGIEE